MLDVAHPPIAARDEALLADHLLRDLAGAQGKKRMAAPAVEIMPLLIEPDIMEAEQDFGKAADGDVELALHHVAQQLIGGFDLDGELHIAARGREFAEQRGKVGARIGDGVVEQADREGAADPRPQGAGAHVEPVDRREELLHLREDGGAVIGELEPGAAAPAELDAEPRLQRRDLVADGRGADIQHRLRGGEAARLHHRGEDPQQAEINRVQPRHASTPLSV
jgi:hypothetical protein